ncbi:esterase-like activity of phytase family protein [Larkinella soli]|uniref:esterase-like activity of phytase family protein n=1 Tax=Larkinella soli TaxID=1770527 RepID=UPI0013E31C7D|nr:esterase-like activity of phytase family protein [Larkinella soli]
MTFRFLPFLLLALSPPTSGQAITFSFRDFITLPRSRNLHGISGMEYIASRKEWLLAGDRGALHRYSDLDRLSDWACRPDSVAPTGLFLEAIRYDPVADTHYFAVENDRESFVGFRRGGLPRPGEGFERLPLPHPMPDPSTNKGIEALALTDRYLWVAPEAGSQEEARPDRTEIHFYRYRKTDAGLTLDGEFAYEIDRNVCANEALGGISEIIAVPGDETRLLVLERCYQRPTVTVRLYEVTIDEAARRLVKRKDRPAFDFNVPGFRPDNLEGMAWGEDENGRKILYLVSDDNLGKSQWTQIIQLEMQPATP